jgi:hypothetical protein
LWQEEFSTTNQLVTFQYAGTYTDAAGWTQDLSVTDQTYLRFNLLAFYKVDG